jgi:hypothetical protein
MSYPATVTITLNTEYPTVVWNSPTGGLMNPGGGSQSQYINGAAAQWLTYTALSPVGETLTMEVDACNPTCAAISSGSNPATPFMWDWQDPLGTTFSYIQVSATDQADNQTFKPNPVSFTFFNGSSTVQDMPCNSASQCEILGDQSPNEVPNDPPSPAYMITDTVNFAFSGYSDPSMRADQLISQTNSNGPANPNGSNLFMLYSWPTLNYGPVCGLNECENEYSGSVETHLA